MDYTIKRSGSDLITVRPEGTQRKSIMGEDIVDMSFMLPYFVRFQIGDTVDVYGGTYTIDSTPSFTEKSTREYEYQLQFKGGLYGLDKIQFFNYDSSNALKETDFSIMGTPDLLMDLLITNINRVSTGWTKGTIDAGEAKNLTFSKDNCLRVLSRLAEEFSTEFWVEGKTIHLTKKGVASGLVLGYGKGNGLYSLKEDKKDDSNVITRVYAFGGEKNIPGNYRSYSSRLKMPVATGAYLEKNVDKYGVIEHTEVFEDVFPRRTGTVSAIDAGNHLNFTDSTIDFDVNAQLIPGVTAKVIFKTGQLAGYEFELSKFNNTTKVFTLIVNKQEKSVEIPSTLLKPAIGDQYVLIDIIMPQSYITAAENELQAAAQAFLDKNSIVRVIHSVEADRLHLKRNNYSLILGNTVNISDTPTGINTTPRIISYTRDLNEPFFYPSLELSESVQLSNYVRLVTAQEKVQRSLTANNLFDPNRARSSWKTTRELSTILDTLQAEMLLIMVEGGAYNTNIVAEVGLNLFKTTAGTVSHQEYPGTWNIAASNHTLVTNSPHYTYIRANKAGTDATVIAQTTEKNVDPGDGFYYFPFGIISSIIDNNRFFTSTKGYTRVTGGNIQTGSITSSDGNTKFDLDNGTISGRIVFGTVGVSTTVDGNLVTTSTIILGNGIIDNAGISGAGTLTTDIRFWAGASFANRSTAAFRVDQSGKLWATNASISGHIEATSGTIAGVSISAGNGFTLNGTKVQIDPSAGITVSGYLNVSAGNMVLPLAPPTTATAGSIWLGTGNSSTAPVGGPQFINDLVDVTITGIQTGQTLVWDGVAFVNQAAASGVSSWNDLTDKPTTLSGYGIQTEGDGRWLGINATASNSTKWGNQLWDDQYKTGSFTFLVNNSGGWGYTDANQVKAALGLGSAAYLNNGSLTASSLNGYITLLNNDNFNTAPFTILAKNSAFDNTVYTFTDTAIKAWLGLGSNAFSSTAYLPLSGGNLSGALTTSGQLMMLVPNTTFFDKIAGGPSRFASVGSTAGAVGTMIFSQYSSGGEMGRDFYTIDASGNNTWTGSGTFGGALTGTSATFSNEVIASKYTTTGGYHKQDAYSINGDFNWAFGSRNIGSEYWMQVSFYGLGNNARGFCVRDSSNDTFPFKVDPTVATFNVPLTGTSATFSGTITGTLSGNASSASILQTTRTLWGQSFNGSGNISGTLTGVTDLTASGVVQAHTLKATNKMVLPTVAPAVPEAGAIWITAL